MAAGTLISRALPFSKDPHGRLYWFSETPKSSIEGMCAFYTRLGTKQAQALKQTILEEAAGTSNGLKASQQQRDAISKAVNGLVALNPTEDIITSELATGTWNLVYTTTSGASGGKLGPFVGEVQQEVDIADGVYVNYVRVGPLTGELEATWEVVNKNQWKVVFKTIAFSLFEQQLVKKELGQAGLWTLSYLDNDMRVLTARSLERDTGNLYVLARAKHPLFGT